MVAGAEEGDATVTKQMWIGMQDERRRKVVDTALRRWSAVVALS